MALIIFPAEGCNSYVSNTDADTLAQGYLTYPSWDALTPEVQDRYLQQAFRIIQGLNGFTEPSAVGCLATAQVEIAMNDNYYQISLSTTSPQEVKKEKAGPVEMEYFQTGQAFDPSIIPPTSSACLKQNGWTGYQGFNGLSTLRHHR